MRVPRGSTKVDWLRAAVAALALVAASAGIARADDPLNLPGDYLFLNPAVVVPTSGTAGTSVNFAGVCTFNQCPGPYVLQPGGLYLQACANPPSGRHTPPACGSFTPPPTSIPPQPGDVLGLKGRVTQLVPAVNTQDLCTTGSTSIGSVTATGEATSVSVTPTTINTVIVGTGGVTVKGSGTIPSGLSAGRYIVCADPKPAILWAVFDVS